MRHTTGQATTHRVRWEIDVEAQTTLEAARLARRLQVAPHTTAVVFHAWPTNAPSKARRIDLAPAVPAAVEPADILLATVQAFPGLFDGDTDVNGVDLVEFLTQQLREQTVRQAFVHDGPATPKP